MRKRERPKAESVREMKKQTRDMEMLIKCLNRRNTVRKKWKYRMMRRKLEKSYV
jgi:hypothetical protein